MKILYFGSYNQEHPRNQILIDGLKRNGVQVTELCDRGNILVKYFRLFFRHFRYRNQYDFMVVGFPGFTIMPLAQLVATAPIIFDAFLSFYDSNVFDRKVCRPGSIRAKYYFFLDWLSCQLADIVLLDTNEHIKYFVEKFGIKQEKFRRIFIGAHDKIFKPGNPLQAESYKLQVLFWGWIIPLHGVEFILQAAKILQNQAVKFTFIGGGAEKKNMLKLKDELGLRNVEFLPAVEAEKLPDYIAGADLCLGIFGATGKTQRVIPNKLYEALACQKPVITADTPAAREALVSGEHCLFCRAGDARDLADKILILKDDEKLRDHIAREGRKLYLNKFTPDTLGRELLDIMENYAQKK